MASEIVSVTIRLPNAELVINPRMQTIRATMLDGSGAPIGKTEEMSLSKALEELAFVQAIRAALFKEDR